MTKTSKAREYHLLRTYGLTLKQYNDLLRGQGGVCWICQKPPKANQNLCVDHIHVGPKRGLIRGVLCRYCNHRLVGRHTDPILVRRIADYLEQDTGYYVPEKKKKKRKKKRGR